MFLHYFEMKGIIVVSRCNLHYKSLITFIHFQLSGQLLAAYGYGAPEFESGIYTYQSDVYSFGVVMLELLTGRQSYDKWDTLTKILWHLFLAFRGLKIFVSCTSWTENVLEVSSFLWDGQLLNFMTLMRYQGWLILL